ncbi:Ig-like domain-containing protein [Anaerosporobacter faecicola]|uniref:Ig-like domain-containing protein n=1 Tax=Anaerosporobacter faecicola TaxID=2718714 RepID=UPI001438ADDD|nr:Ig-like domain-containing protein [Anaerosporobacter faecicola]
MYPFKRQVGTTMVLPYTVTPAATPITFVSSNEEVASVAADGTVTANGYGNATITAVAGDAMAKCVIIVPEGADGILGEDTATVGYDKTSILMYQVEPATASNKNLNIISSDSDQIRIKSTQRVGETTYVTVEAVGTVGGTATIKASLESDATIYKETQVQIVDLAVSGIVLDKTNLALTANGADSIASGAAIGTEFIREGSVQAEFLVDGELCPLDREVEWQIDTGSDCVDIIPSGNTVTIQSKQVGEADVTAKISTIPGAVTYVYQTVHVNITAEPLVIDTVDALEGVTTVVGEQPVLPSAVRVYYTNGSYGDVSINWDSIDQNLLYTVGNFDATGTIAGTTRTVSASVTVNPKSITATDIRGISGQIYTGGTVTLPIRIYNGSRMLVEGTDYSLVYQNNDKIGDATVIITGLNNYIDSIQYDFSIYNRPVEEVVTVTSVEISKLPSHLSYTEGETLDSTGLVLTVHYSNGTTADVTTGFQINTTQLTSTGTNVITVSYQGYKLTYSVYVREKQVIRVEKVTNPNKLQYRVGDTIDLTGLTIKVVYDNKEEKLIDTGFTADTTKLSKAGKKIIKVTYENKNVYFTVIVTPKKITGVKIKARKNKSSLLVWKKQDNVSGYQIYVATSKNGKYKKLATVSKKKYEYALSKLDDSKTYYLKVRAYKTIDGVKKYGAFSSVVCKKAKK